MVRAGFTLRMAPMSPNWSEQSTRATRARLARATAQLAAMIDLPTPPLPANTVKTRPLRVGAGSAAGGTALRSSNPWTRRIAETSSSPVNGFWRNSRAPASIARR